MQVSKMAESKPQIFAFAVNEWHTPYWMARQHLFTRLAARGWPVVYSTGPQSFWERNTDKWRRSSLAHHFDTEHAGNGAAILVDRPGKYLPHGRHHGAWYDFVVDRHARHLMNGDARAAKRKRIAYLWHPRFWPYVRRLNPDYVVFHIYDPWDVSQWSATTRQNLMRLADRANIIITVAENMARGLPGVGPGRALALPHGVDFDAVRLGASSPCPPDLVGISRPRIGYTGRVNLKLDYPLILQAAAAKPDWNWIFIGETGIGSDHDFQQRPDIKLHWDQLKKARNVHFLGVKDRREIPAYLHSFDVLTLPFNPQFTGLPTKLFEYLASGKPIVSWDSENVQHLSHLVDIAEGPADWIAAIDRALEGRGRGTAEQRVAMAKSDDWEQRTDTLEHWLSEMVNGHKFA